MEIFLDKETKIRLALKQAYMMLKNAGYEPFGVFLYGSQNYGLDTEDSDVDVKAIIIREESPSYNPLNNTIMFTKNKEHICIVDISRFINILEVEKQPDWLEILFTRYYYCNPKYKAQWELIRKKREEIIAQNKELYLGVLLTYMREEIDFSTRSSYVPLERQRNKRLAYIMRLGLVIEKYSNGLSYESSLIPTEQEKETLLHQKYFARLDEKEIEARRQEAITQASLTIDKYKQKNINQVTNLQPWLEEVLEERNESKI